jgi:uncharacterized membrane protein
MAPPQSSDRLERSLGRLLQVGVLVSAGCLAIGLIGWMLGAAPSLTDAALTAGLLMLMATPIVSVVVSLVVYVRTRDWFFVAATLAVFVLLAITVWLAYGRAGSG